MKIVHCKKEPYDVYIGRPSKWGNPFIIGKDGTREEVIAKYKDWINGQPELLSSLHEIRGKVLGCWCENSACHGDVLIELCSKPKLKLAVIGSRSILDEKLIFETLDQYKDRIELIISGGANGVDSIANKYAKKNGLSMLIHYPKWTNDDGTKNMAAGFQRNTLIIQSSNAVMAFWDGVSKGTMDSVNKAKEMKIPIKVIRCQ